MEKKITLEQKYALIIMTAYNIGCNVFFKTEAENIIKNGIKIRKEEILWFERDARAAYHWVRKRKKMKEANKVAEDIYETYLNRQTA